MCALIATSCQMRSRCTEHPGERDPASGQTQTDANALDEENQLGEEVTVFFFFWITHSAHSLKLKNLANVIHCMGFDTRMCVNITASGSLWKKKTKKQYWDYETSTQRKRHVYAISNMCGLCAKYSKPNWHGSRQRATSSSRLLFSVFCHAHVTHILCAYPY